MRSHLLINPALSGKERGIAPRALAKGDRCDLLRMPKASIVILTFNSQAVITDCLNSVLHSDTPIHRIIVVDNNSSDKTVDIIKRSDLQREAESRPKAETKEGQTFQEIIKLIENKENLGFSAGNNVAIKYAMEDESDYVFLLNPDTTIKPDTLRILLDAEQSDSQIGIIGPKTLYPSGRCHLPKVTPSQGEALEESQGDRIMYAGGILDWQNVKNYHQGMGEIDCGQYDQFGETGFVSGAALFISRKVIEKIGFLDEKYFLYYEDADWCVRAKKAGFKIMYQPKAIVHHQESTATKKGSPNYYYYFTRNRLYFIAKFFNPIKAVWLYFLETIRAVKNIIKLFNKSEREQSLAILQGMGDFVRGRFGRR